MATLDIALWDIPGEAPGLPGVEAAGDYRDSVPIFGSGGWLSDSTDQLLEEMKSYVRRGFKCVKM